MNKNIIYLRDGTFLDLDKHVYDQRSIGGFEVALSRYQSIVLEYICDKTLNTTDKSVSKEDIYNTIYDDFMICFTGFTIYFVFFCFFQ